MRSAFALAGGVLVLDQLTKWWALEGLAYARPVPLLPGLNLTLLFNEGAAFSFLSGAGGWQRWFFTLLAIAVSVVLVLWIRRLPPAERVTGWGLGLVLGGAIGNVIDRLRLGHVVDFIDVYYQRWHWPAFNVADSAITIGVVLLLIDGIILARRRGPAGGN